MLGLFFLFLITAFGPKTPRGIKPKVVLRGAEFSVEIARSPSERSRGLSGRDSLPKFGLKPDGSAVEGGMLFQFEKPGIYSFWMKGMRFPIDIIWLKGGRVVYIVKNAPEPAGVASDLELPVYTSPAEADAILEVNAGMAERYGISVDDPAEIIF